VEGFEVYSGPDHLVLWALQNGAAGCISGLGNAMPQVLSGIIESYNAGDIAEAERQQAIFTAFRTDLYALGFAPAMVKRALYLQDASVGPSRQPALLPNAEQDGKIAEILRRYGLL
jgi:4-hydroxy-tetrahydrodipicolinate synthase